jgi:indole-3-glycerol phosphate synthase
MGLNPKNMFEYIKTASKFKNPILAEIKIKSPIKGDLLRNRDPIDILKEYERAGAVGISYITEKNIFGGDIRLFKKICKSSNLPVLRKDFITDKKEIELTADYGASAILLIARILKDKTGEFVDYSFDNGLEPLVEIHSTDDVLFLRDTKTRMVGINNRDILRMETDDGDVSLSENLANYLKNEFVSKKSKDYLVISESGIKNVEDLRKVLKIADAALIGTAFMESDDTEHFVRSFVFDGLNKTCIIE